MVHVFHNTTLYQQSNWESILGPDLVQRFLLFLSLQAVRKKFSAECSFHHTSACSPTAVNSSSAQSAMFVPVLHSAKRGGGLREINPRICVASETDAYCLPAASSCMAAPNRVQSTSCEELLHYCTKPLGQQSHAAAASQYLRGLAGYMAQRGCLSAFTLPPSPHLHRQTRQKREDTSGSSTSSLTKAAAAVTPDSILAVHGHQQQQLQGEAVTLHPTKAVTAVAPYIHLQCIGHQQYRLLGG